jgi:hypothetical protein
MIARGALKVKRRETIMKTVAGIFTSQAAAERAAEGLRSKGIAPEHINFLTPGASRAQLETVPTTEFVVSSIFGLVTRNWDRPV